MMKRIDEEKLLLSTKDQGTSLPVQIKTQTARIHHRWCTPWCVVCVLFVAICIIVSASWLKGSPLTVINMQLIYFDGVTNSTDETQPVNITESTFTTESPQPSCELDNVSERFDCHPEPQPSKERCEMKGCCWDLNGNTSISAPSCFFPKRYDPHEVEGEVKETESGFAATLKRRNQSSWSRLLKVDMYLESKTRFHFKIYKPSALRDRNEMPVVTKKSIQTDYHLAVLPKPFSLRLTRKSTNSVIFDTGIPSAPAVIAEPYIQISTKVPSGFLYGLNGCNSSFLVNMSNWCRSASGSTDLSQKTVNRTHSFYLSTDTKSTAFGVFITTSDPTEIDVQPYPALTFRTNASILEFYLFTGPTPELVLRQFSDVIGKPNLPPYWALGFDVNTKYKETDNVTHLINSNHSPRFSGSGQSSGLVTADVSPTWTGLRESLTSILSHQLNGVTFVRSGICSMADRASEELCIRWYQLGTFFPYMNISQVTNSISSDSGGWSTEARRIIGSALRLRSTLLPYLYTLLYQSHLRGDAVVKPLYFEYLTDTNTLAIDKQFLFGSALLISPVLYSSHTTVSAYISADTWYNFENGSVLDHKEEWVTLPSTLDTINVHQRGGTIIPTLDDTNRTSTAGHLPFSLSVALDREAEAQGSLYWNNDEEATSNYTVINFRLKQGLLVTSPSPDSFSTASVMILQRIRVLGMKHEPSKVVVNGKRTQFGGDELDVIFFLGAISVKWKFISEKGDIQNATTRLIVHLARMHGWTLMDKLLNSTIPPDWIQKTVLATSYSDDLQYDEFITVIKTVEEKKTQKLIEH